MLYEESLKRYIIGWAIRYANDKCLHVEYRYLGVHFIPFQDAGPEMHCMHVRRIARLDSMHILELAYMVKFFELQLSKMGNVRKKK